MQKFASFWTLFSIFDFKLDVQLTNSNDSNLHAIYSLLAYLNCPIQVLNKSSMLFLVGESGFFAHLNTELDTMLASLLQVCQKSQLLQPPRSEKNIQHLSSLKI